MREVTLSELLKAGVHFGHQVSRWHPKMKPFIFAARNGIYILDLEQTKERLERAANFAGELAAKGGKVLYIGTKRQAKAIVEREAQRVGMPYVTNRWIGGTFTNFPTVSRVIAKYKKLKSEVEGGQLGRYTKREQLGFKEELERLEGLVGGISTLDALPAAVFIVDVKQERTAMKEALKVGIPVIAIVDTNVNPKGVTYPIPSNDDATKALDLILSVMTDEILSGKQKADIQVSETKEKKVEVPKEEAADEVEDEQKDNPDDNDN